LNQTVDLDDDNHSVSQKSRMSFTNNFRKKNKVFFIQDQSIQKLS